jgi:endonuclease III related protein
MELRRLLELLRREYDVQDWWPSDSAFEVMVGALLIQQTNWESVDKVLARLRSEGLLEVDSMASCEPSRLESIIRPAGFYRQKAKRIIGLAAHIRDRHGSDPMSMLSGPTGSIRKELLSLEGIGSETADSILVFAARRAKFVAAAYSVRVLGRTGVFRSTDYDEVQRFVESGLDGDAKDLRDLYALIVQHAREVCRAVPECNRCALAPECAYFIGTKGR